MIQPVPVDNKRLDWPRLTANAINELRNIVGSRKSFPFDPLATAPSSPTEGQTYYDTALHKVRTWDGTTWQNHW